MHNYESTSTDNPNLWFQEGMAIMARIWALRAMAKTWEHDSLFGAWVAQDGGISVFSTNFNHYADFYLNNPAADRKYEESGADFLEEYEDFSETTTRKLEFSHIIILPINFHTSFCRYLKRTHRLGMQSEKCQHQRAKCL